MPKDARRKRWDKKRGFLLNKYNHTCYLCNKKIDGPCDIDHFIPLDRDGEDALDNLRPTHPWCNQIKLTRLPNDPELPQLIAQATPENKTDRRLCNECGADISHRYNNAVYCEDCLDAHKKAERKRYYEQNKAKVLTRAKAWRKQNPEYRKKYHEAENAYAREYRTKNAEKVRAREAKYNARRREETKANNAKRKCLDCKTSISDRGHSAKRCIACAKERDRRGSRMNYLRHKDKRIAQASKWNRQNPEKRSRYNKAYCHKRRYGGQLTLAGVNNSSL